MEISVRFIFWGFCCIFFAAKYEEKRKQKLKRKKKSKQDINNLVGRWSGPDPKEQK